MIRKVSYESQERREKQVLAALNANGIKSLEEANQICEDAGVDPYQMCEDTQRICFENAKWAYVAGAAIAIKQLGLNGKYLVRDVWQHRDIARKANRWKGKVTAHETKAFVLR
jgi:hypothetical protein